MGSSIFADESGDESAREERTDEREPSVFRRPDGTDRASTDDTDEQRPRQDDRESQEGDGDEATTMTVFSGDEVFEVAVDDDRESS